MPRTAGTFLRTVLEDKVIGFSDHGFSINMINELRLKNKPIFGFNRDPVDWYQSWYSLIKNGSEVFPTNSQDPTLMSLGTDKNIDEVIQSLVLPTEELKRKAFQVAILARGGRLEIVMLKILKRWLESDGLSFYQNMQNCYLSNCNEVGKYENLRDDIFKMLSQSNSMDAVLEAKIYNTPVINHAKRESVSKDTVTLIKKVESYE